MKTDGIADASTACGLRVAGEGGEWAGAVASVTVHVCRTRGRHLVTSRSGETRAPGGRTQKGRFCGYVPTETCAGRWVPGGRCQREGSRRAGAAGDGCSFRLLFLALPWLQQEYAAHQSTRDQRGSGSSWLQLADWACDPPFVNWPGLTCRVFLHRELPATADRRSVKSPPTHFLEGQRRQEPPLAQFDPTTPDQLRCDHPDLDSTRLDPTQGKAARRVGIMAVESWCDEALR